MLFPLLATAQVPKNFLSDVQRQIAFISDSVRGGQSWTAVNGAHITLNYVSSPNLGPEKAAQYRDAFEGALSSDCKTLNLDLPADKVVFYLYPDAKALGKAVGSPVPLPEGISFNDWAAVVDDPKGLTSDLKGLVAEGAARVLIHTQLDAPYGCPLFTDGLVQLLRSTFLNEAWTSRPASADATPLRKFVAAPQTPQIAITQGSRLCAYLLQEDHGDPTRLKQLITELSKQRLADLRSPGKLAWDARVEHTCAEVFGKNLDGLEAAWRAKYKS